MRRGLPTRQTGTVERLDAAAVTEELPADPQSARRARRFVAAALADAGYGAVVETAALLVSEVVTNAVLHAGTPIVLACSWSGPCVRIEVRDGSPVLPGIRHYDDEATTGRGLSLVATLADRWGVDAGVDGKALWFELGARPGEPDGGDAVPGGEPPAAAVRLLGASPALLLATIQYGDAVLRELALLSLGGELEDVLPGGWRLPRFDVGPVLTAAGAARDAGRDRADLVVALPADAGETALERLRLIDRADELARRGRLLVQPALPEIGACRHWLYSQVHEQLLGVEPQPWHLPDRLLPARAAAALSVEDAASVREATVATVVADDANRIIQVNQPAGELLGWDPETLVGQRLTVLIPAELRERHLAGFSRLQLTGEARLLDRPVDVPALRRDGSRVEVVLTIHAVEGSGGRRAFRATLRPRGAPTPTPE